MLGKRCDGRVVKKIDPLERIIPYIMKTRTDSMNQYSDDFDCDGMDQYMAAKKLEGIKYSYMHIIIAAMVRTIAQRPRLNRFVKNGRIYARNEICISLCVQRNLRVEAAETTLKFHFNGTETLEDVRRQIDDTIEKTMQEEENGTDKTADIIMKLPGWLIKFFIGIINWLDNHELLPKWVNDVSPFHTTVFVTNLKSLGINYLFHHTYEFGTTGLFLAMGKERRRVVPIHGKEETEIRKILTLGIVTDERFCDGLYFARAMRYFRKYLRDPSLLEEPLEKKIEDDQL